MKRFSLLLILLTTILILAPQPIVSAQTETEPPVDIYMFGDAGCPYCADAVAFLDDLAARTPQVNVHYYEVTNDDASLILWQRMADAFGFSPRGFPTIFLGDQYWEGFTEETGQQIESAVQGCLDGSCPNAGAGVIPGVQGAPATPEKVVITMFWGDGCPHCANAKPFLEDLAKRYPNVELDFYEVWYNDENMALFTEATQKLGFDPHGVPTIIIGDRYWEGWSDEIGEQIEAIAKGASASDVPTEVIKLPLIGEVNLHGKSIWISTLLIAFVDGVNPCSIWVLSILLALTLRTGSRKKVLTIGLIFITVTALVYALFIAGLFTVLSIVSFAGWIRVVVALVALFFALVNIKDYFFYKEGVSFTIDDKHKPGIYQRIRKVMDASDNFWSLAGATVVMAAGVSLVEFSCTAGFPVLWTNLLTAQQVSTVTFIVLLLLYMVIYQLDELAIFGAAVFTLKSSKMEEKHGRILKLVGGTLMLTLAVVMVVNPNLMNDLGKSLIIFAIAFALAGLILLLHRRILPSMGIWIGSEKRPTRKQRGQRH